MHLNIRVLKQYVDSKEVWQFVRTYRTAQRRIRDRGLCNSKTSLCTNAGTRIDPSEGRGVRMRMRMQLHEHVARFQVYIHTHISL